MPTYKKILFTGGNGMMGRAFGRLNIPDAVFVDRDEVNFTDFAQTRDIFSKIKPDAVVHLAALSGGVLANSTHIGEYYTQNIMVNTNVLEAARLAGVNRVVSFMPTCVFPDKAPYPLNEKTLHDGEPHYSNFGFAFAKRMLDVQSRAYRKQWGLDYVCVIPPNIYGPEDNFSLIDSHVLSALIHRCYLAKEKGADLVVWGSGKPLREFVLCDDVAKLVMLLLEDYHEESPILLSSGVETSISDLAHSISELMSFSGKIVQDTTKPDGQLRKPSDTAKLKNYFPDFTWTPVKEGLRITISWFLKNYPNVKH